MQSVSAEITTPRDVVAITQHAALRMQQRGIAIEAVEQVLTFGRRIHAKGITYRVVGRKEVAKYSPHGVDVTACQGLQVLVSSDGAVVTAYRNHDLHGIRVTKGRGQKKCSPACH